MIFKGTEELGSLLRGEQDALRAWIEACTVARIARALLLILAGTALYGAAMGSWRAPTQALFVALKFPLIILITTAGNAVLNAMLAPLLGLTISWRRCFLAMLLSFVIAAAILGSFSPLIMFLVWDSLPMSPAFIAGHMNYNLILLLHVVVIALAGFVANLRLASLLG